MYEGNYNRSGNNASGQKAFADFVHGDTVLMYLYCAFVFDETSTSKLFASFPSAVSAGVEYDASVPLNRLHIAHHHTKLLSSMHLNAVSFTSRAGIKRSHTFTFVNVDNVCVVRLPDCVYYAFDVLFGARILVST